MSLAERARERWDAGTGAVAIVLLHAGALLGETATEGRAEPGGRFATSIVEHATVYAVSQYLIGLGGLCFIWFAWTVRRALRRAEGEPGRLADLAFGAGAGWGVLWVLVSLLGASALLLADHFQHPEGARLVASLELSLLPLSFAIEAAFVGAVSLTALQRPVLPRWLAWSGAVLAALILVAATLQPLVDPLGVRPTGEVGHPVSFITGLLGIGLFQFWVIVASVALVIGRRVPPP